MNFLNGVLIILGLAVFEIISSIDNAVINAEILGTMSSKARKWFLGWGFILSVIVVRGILPFFIEISVKKSAPIILGGGGVFLLFLFLNWFFVGEKKDEKIFGISTKSSDFKKILYLEIIDSIFSLDGVLGAFAFTLYVPYILIGNGIGAYVLRTLTVKNIDKIKKYTFLKEGAMYAILSLSIIMLAGAFGYNAPEWVSPTVMFLIVGFFFLRK